MTTRSSLRTCPEGHEYYKSSDCPTCPVCETGRKPLDSFFAELSGPARRALENNGITTLQTLSGYTVKDILNLHGMGPASIPKLKAKLLKAGLSFRE